MKKFVYMFDEGNAKMKELLGGKGANLAEMTIMGLPIPQGFTVTTEACIDYYDQDGNVSAEIIKQIDESIAKLEDLTKKRFSDNEDPLLLSVRSGARASMPGMMDTVLNLGLNDVSVEGLAKQTENPRFAYDSYCRFIQMFADVVMDISKTKFDVVTDEIKAEKNYKSNEDLTADDWKKALKEFKAIYKKEKGEDFPQDAKEQLLESVKAVFRSWNTPRAIVYRRMHGIPGDWGTAVNVQLMVFGNMGEDSGTGVAFTRNPATGENEIYGEYLINAQGEDVVAGIRTPNPISTLEQEMPEVFKEFMEITEKLEQHYKDMQDVEFTIEKGKLYFLQTRDGKRTAEAALKIAVDMVNANMINEKEALLRVDPKQLNALLHPVFDDKALKETKEIASALPASPGAASGRVYFNAEDAKNAHNDGERVILARLETSPEDIEGMAAARGILTVRGGMTSHAAVVARGMGTCCVAGCGTINIDEDAKLFRVDDVVVKEGDYISLDGSTGKVYNKDLPTKDPEISGDFAKYMSWVDKYRDMKVRTNADTPKDAQNAINFGAEGIGLCRTEHMFFDEERIGKMRRMILSDCKEEREKALAELLPYQKDDFVGIFEVMEERPVTVRLLDPPLHEFLPQDKKTIEKLAKDMNITVAELNSKIAALHEFNPMMGHRGCRLAVTYPEIAQMQARAIIEAAIEVKKNKGYNIVPEIMVPLIGEVKEFTFIKDFITETADQVIADSGIDLKYLVGTMIEIPRACITADEIAKEADFFSFGTNDLTQMTFGFSRDDAAKFLDDYFQNQIYESDPFERLDIKGVGTLVEMAVEKGRAAKPDIKLGVCGEHGGDASSVEFFYQNDLEYVSCSPFRVPISRLAAAQAAIKNGKRK